MLMEPNKYWEQLGHITEFVNKNKADVNEPTREIEYNEPSHYHEHDIDTIEFLQRGFPPDVFHHFCQANIIKYTQRAMYKNGRDDILKVVDYAKRWLDWHDKTHS